MLVGNKTQWDGFCRKYANNPSQIERMKQQMVWINADIWYRVQPHDGEMERRAIAIMKSTGKMINPSELYVQPPAVKPPPKRPPAIAETPGSVHVPLVKKPPPGPKANPPAKTPPAFFSKVAQYWRATHGDRVDEVVFKDRFKACTEIGGHTWAPLAGQVVAIDKDTADLFTVVVGNTMVPLLKGETPTVTVGANVVRGQIIGESSTPMPCPYLITQNDNLPDSKEQWCNACGCGAGKAAKLSEKLYWAKVECPRTPPLFTAVTVSAAKP